MKAPKYGYISKEDYTALQQGTKGWKLLESKADFTEAGQGQDPPSGSSASRRWPPARLALRRDHTIQPVPVHAKGAGSKQLAKRAVAGDPVRGKYLDNTDLANVLLQDLWANCSQAMGKRR